MIYSVMENVQSTPCYIRHDDGLILTSTVLLISSSCWVRLFLKTQCLNL